MSQHSTQVSAKVEQSGDVRILTFTDGKVRDVHNVLASELEGRVGGMAEGHLMLDFTNVTRISSEELGTLVGLHKQVRSSGGRLTLFNLRPAIYEVFLITRLESLLAICRENQVPTEVMSRGKESNGVVPKASSHDTNLCNGISRPDTH